MTRALSLARRADVPRTVAVPVWALGAAVVLPVVFVTAWVFAGTRQPADYSPVRQTVSVMAGHGGTDRWIMSGALAVMALCYAVLALGLTTLRSAPRVVLAVCAIAACGIVLSPEPAVGTTVRHTAWAAIGEVALTLWPLLAATGDGRIVARRTADPLITATVLLAAWLAVETYWGHGLGLAERVTVSVQVCWPLLIVLALRRRADPDRGLAAASAVRATRRPPRSR